MTNTATPPAASATHVPAGADAPWLLVFGAWLAAACATLGAIFLSEVVRIPPCVLCWYQRVFMFPLVFVLGVGLLPWDRKVLRYAAPLVAGGWLVALYHLLLVHGVVPKDLSPCTEGVPCSQIEALWFGFVTLPLLSLAAFTLIGLLLALAARKSRP
jgi:disulfide bond formation protein DsbB